jgi:hypothetical protein
MSPTQLHRSSTHATQLMITGRVIDDHTQGAPANPVTLSLQGLNGDWSAEALRLALKQLPDGAFAYYGDPLSAFPDKGQIYQLRLSARAAGYAEKTEDFTIGPLGDQPEAVTFTPHMTESGPITARLFRGGGLPRRGILIQVTRDPVSLQGVVANAAEPSERLAGASVKVKQAYKLEDGSLSTISGLSATTGAGGDFSLALPVVLAVVMEVEAQNFSVQAFTHTIDYSQPVNKVQLALVPETL